ncbi:hypothetical protein [Arenimonas donghaensis]|uniref:Uncharacterized protein n=1 Tax=Arenimonas donghaensis DSM 18148 = HO3-R19 TaxID=1121014 RepID=A0A087MFQ4_9GAMM|nr:hypothetical protein [Arenimonas donghaensis]KFL35707.1 hypothetical protein N788_08190 [Arenimonas donghaensis DSM 18148 = HO3-R19]
MLTHAYGLADDVPARLEQIHSFPAETDWQSEPWFSLWSALYHQGNIYSASLAAVPFIVSAMSATPSRATLSFYLLPTSIAVADHINPVDVPREIRRSFAESLYTVGTLAKAELPSISDANISTAARAAALVSEGSYQQAGELLDADA